jgi:hypothetical protein
MITFGKYRGRSIAELLADKTYLRWLNDQPRLMAWLRQRHKELHDKIKAAAPTLDDRIQTYIDTAPPAVSGQGGSHQTFSVACVLAWGFDLSETEALRYLRIYNQRCQPAWTDKELKQKIKSAGKSEYHDKPRGYLL